MNQGQFSNKLKNDLRRVCPKCNAQVTYADLFCPKCLTKMVRDKDEGVAAKKECRICQTLNENEATVCRICKVKFDK